MNSIATIKGGTHVDYITNQITSYVMNKVNKKKKDANVKAHNVKNHLWVFVNALIDNPAFDSQTKETLTTRQTSFGSKCDVPEPMLKEGSSHYHPICYLYFVIYSKLQELVFYDRFHKPLQLQILG